MENQRRWIGSDELPYSANCTMQLTPGSLQCKKRGMKSEEVKMFQLSTLQRRLRHRKKRKRGEEGGNERKQEVKYV